MDTFIIIGTVVITALVAFAVWASTDIGSGVWVKTLFYADTDRREIALTFDDGPHPEHTPLVLDVLSRHGSKATFFVTGERAAAHPEIVRRIADEGHAIGNHTQHHSSWFPLKSARAMAREIEECDEVIEKITGTRPEMFRPPFGVTNPSLARALKLVNKAREARGEAPHTVAGWNIRSLDTISQWSRGKVFERICRRLRLGSVVLLHDDRPGSEMLLAGLLIYLDEVGCKVERFDKLFL
ncbi:MAG: polysaccharide deacetylase family protein [Alistipes sp.]|jgi:peptidoglycan/xylan/chitin deacetylase (PgdA/CDA1 family)|nr:polysaccharide deacetylase family protein [Alistipes sp.]